MKEVRESEESLSNEMKKNMAKRDTELKSLEKEVSQKLEG